MKVGVAIDEWKAEIFRRHLTDAGYAFKEGPGPAGTMILTVETVDPRPLEAVVRAANGEARRSKMT